MLDVTANDDGSVVTATTNTEIFVVRDGESGKVPLPSRQMTSTPVRLSDDGSLAVAGLYDGPLVVIDTATRAITRSWDASSSIMDVDVSPDGSLAAAGLISGHVLVASPDDGTEHILDPGLGTIQALAFSPDGGLVLAGSTGRLTLVDPADGTVIRTFDSGVAGRVEIARFSPDGALLLTGGSDNALRIWRVASGEQLASLPTVRPYAIRGRLHRPECRRPDGHLERGRARRTVPGPAEHGGRRLRGGAAVPHRGHGSALPARGTDARLRLPVNVVRRMRIVGRSGCYRVVSDAGLQTR